LLLFGTVVVVVVLIIHIISTSIHIGRFSLFRRHPATLVFVNFGVVCGFVQTARPPVPFHLQYMHEEKYYMIFLHCNESSISKKIPTIFRTRMRIC